MGVSRNQAAAFAERKATMGELMATNHAAWGTIEPGNL
jgi:hypothetical protein